MEELRYNKFYNEMKEFSTLEKDTKQNRKIKGFI